MGKGAQAWRILANLNTNLCANINTKFGLTREINMEIGGKQGSRLTGRMFAKLIDLIAEDLSTTEEGFNLTQEFKVSVLLWVDDVISLIEGEENQRKILDRMHEFAIKHKLTWGQNKCQVMRTGKHKNKKTSTDNFVFSETLNNEILAIAR